MALVSGADAKAAAAMVVRKEFLVKDSVLKMVCGGKDFVLASSCEVSLEGTQGICISLYLFLCLEPTLDGNSSLYTNPF